ncbi:MAG: hypothetical protein ICV51_14335 [Flavisolibacter sp.]|nr:hypothetical protein [Flavisolibacter sp.]MBD0376795.1 hypothetical protein [Flavisolibacter sp.]
MMKKVILSILLLSFTALSFSQQTETEPSQTAPNVDYLKRSKHQKTAAWILTSAGTVGLLVTMMSDAAQAVGGGLTTVFSLGTVEPEYKSYTAYYLLSAAGVGAGIGFFIAAGKNKRKAMAMDASTYLKMERAPVVQSGSIRNQPYPSVAVRMTLH